MPLCEAMHDPMGLVSVERTIDIQFVVKDPIVGDENGTTWAWHESPCMVGEKCVVLLLHNGTPVVIVEGFTDGGQKGEAVATVATPARAYFLLGKNMRCCERVTMRRGAVAA